MGSRVSTTISRMPRPACGACHGMGSIRMTAHFYTGDREWEAPCWECFGVDVRLPLPKPRTTDNA
jgi:DnaJ-class molecular chaperone